VDGVAADSLNARCASIVSEELIVFASGFQVMTVMDKKNDIWP
jgi:hypothetical protein